MNIKKYVDGNGLTHLWTKIEENYPTNEDLTNVINAIDETKADKDELVQSDWNQTDEQSLDFIKNKPFGEVLEKTNEMVWDGIVTDGTEIIIMSADDITLYAARVSDFTPTIEQLSNVEIETTMGIEEVIVSNPIGEIRNITNDIVSDADGGILVVYKDEASLEEGIVFPKAGLYCIRLDYLGTKQHYTSKVTFPFEFTESKIKTIEPKYLPENYLQTVLFTEQVLTEDQKIQARENIDAVGLIETNISVYNYATTGKIEVYLENMICAEYMQHVTPEWILSINDFKFIDNQTNEEILFSETSDENLIIEQVGDLDGMLIFADQMGVFMIFYAPTDNFPFQGIVFPYQGAYLMDYLKLMSEGMSELKEIFSPIPLADITIKKIDEQIVPDTISRVGHLHDVATTDTDGFMSASDKIKLDSLDSFVTKVILRQNSWNNNSKSTQIVINGIKEYNGYETIIDVYPVFDKTNIDTIREYNIYLSEQNSNVLTFVCDTMPSVDVMFYVKYENVKFIVHETELIDFNYIMNDDGTSTITEWKGTTYGVPDTKIIVPDMEYIII